MIKCTILLPNRDNEGVPLGREQKRILALLYELFGGYTIESRSVRGTYCTGDGGRADDISMKVSVCIEPARRGEFERLLPEFARELRQETLYLEKSPAVIEFVPAAKDSDYPKLESKVCKGSEAGQKAAYAMLSDRQQRGRGIRPSDADAPVTIGEFCKVFDGRKTRDSKQAEIDAKNTAWHKATKIEFKVRKDGTQEFGGMLSRDVIEYLNSWKMHVTVYRHKGTVSTVVFPRGCRGF